MIVRREVTAPAGKVLRHKLRLIEIGNGFWPWLGMGREIPKVQPGQQVDGVGRAYDPRPDKLRRTGREASGLPTRGAWSPFSHANYFICTWGKGAYISTGFGRSRSRAARRHNMPAPSSRLPYTATAAPGLRRVDGPQNTRRTGGRSPGRDPLQIFISKSSGARRTNPPRDVVRKRPGHVQESPRRMAGACGGSTAAPVLADLPPMELAAAAARVFSWEIKKKHGRTIDK